MNSSTTDPASASLSQPTLKYVTCSGASTTDSQTHRMAYWSWGDESNPRILVCVHGLSRQGRDFDALARSLSGEYQVVCPDVVGRGVSDWLADPRGYQVFSYVSDMVALVQQLRAQVKATATLDIDWVGTSMGGLIGLGFSTLPAEVTGVKLRRFVLNDVGPKLRHEAVVRIGEYLGQPIRFDSEQQAADYLWSISTGFGPHTPAQWLALCIPLLRQADDGHGFVLRYDPAIAEPFKTMTQDSSTSGEAMLWQVYDALTAQVLLLRGKDSDLLDVDTAASMQQRGPKAKLVEFSGVGHAPTLITPEQISPIRDFLLA
ncbi:MAG: alpha/beta hydrolase [Aquabacterium sp.]|nr:alpha/beta hydrolase [Aquabacterium sp.]